MEAKNNNILIAIIGLAGLVLIVLFLAKERLSFLEKSLLEHKETISSLEKKLNTLQLTTETLVSQTNEETRALIENKLSEERKKLAQVEKQLAAESAARSKAEAELKASNSLSDTKIRELEKNLSSLDLSPIISGWRPRTAYVECFWKNGQSAGSGILMNFIKNNVVATAVLTNEHVLRESGISADRCTIQLPDLGTIAQATRLGGEIEISSDGYDFGRLIIKNPSQTVINRAAGEANVCKTKATLGTEIVILGYPNIGATGDVTATEGIISGYSGDYFITSAKIERGNSGGPAISAKDNCLLGVPTFVTLGALEALARVLDISVLYR